jgi:cytochrome c nitrite reductase small subunit
MKKHYKTLIILVFGGILGISFFKMTHIAMLKTSTPEFCASCHEIQPAYNEWKTSSHASNSKGVVAQCKDCHLPQPENTVEFFYTKTIHGLKDVVGHLIGGDYDRKEHRLAAYESIKSSYCMTCHQNLLYISQKRGAMLAHRSMIYARPGYEKKCTDCHQNLVHKPAAIFSVNDFDPANPSPRG